MYFPYLRYGCDFEINSARTAAYVANRCDICDDPIPGQFHVKDNCDILHYTIDEEGEVVSPATYTTPNAGASWSDDFQPESNRFLGFMIERVTKPSHIGRAVSTKISGFGGGILETLRANAQEYEFEVLLFACDEEAMEFGFRYLTNGLAGGGCDEPCTLCDLEYRDSCPDVGEDPDVDDYNRGLWVLHNVGVTKAPEWMDYPVRGLDYFVRRARFSLASELPWKYKCPTTCFNRSTFDVDDPIACGAAFETWFCRPTELQCAVNETSITGETGFIIEINAGSKTLSGIELQIIPDPWGWLADPDDPEAPENYAGPDPCDTIIVRDLPAGHKLLYDTSVELVSVVKPGGVLVDGTPYLTFSNDGGPPGFPVVRCGTYIAKLIVDQCGVTAGTWATIQTVHREL